MAKSASPFAIRDFRFLWAARFASTLGQNAMVVVIGWQVYDIARRTMSPREAAFQLGLIGLCQFLPLALLTLVSGWTADRVDRRRIGQIALLTESACALALALLAWWGASSLVAIYLVAVTLGASRAFAGPAISALAPNLVPAAILPRAIAASSVAWQVGAIVGPALGGYLYAAAAVDSLCGHGHLVHPVGAVDRPDPPAAADPAGPHRPSVAADGGGAALCPPQPAGAGAISLDLFAVLLGGATAMLPIYARDILKVGAEGPWQPARGAAIGATLAAIWFSVRPLRRHVGVKMLAAVATFGAATLVFGLSRWLPLSLAALAVLGAADMLSVYVRQSLVQIYTPDEMRGRVGAVSTLFISGSNELGEAESGLLASLVGAVPAVVLGGLGAIGITLAWARLFPELSGAHTFDPPRNLDIDPREEMAA